MGYTNFCSLPYTFRRNGTFYLYFRLPDNRFFKSSLACTEIKRARFLTSRLMFFISLLKLGRIENSQLQMIVRKMRQLTQSDIDDYLLEVQTEIYEEARRTKFEAREASISGDKPIPVDLAKGFSEFAGEHLDDTLYNGAKPFSNDHITDYFSAQFDVTGMENQLTEASVQYDYFLKQWQDARTAFFSKNLKDYDAIVKSLEPITPSVPIHITAPTADDSNSENQLTLAEAWNDFLKYKSSWTDKIRKNNGKYFEVMAIVLGTDTAVTKISKQDIKRLLEVAEALPQQNKKPYNRMTPLQVIDLDNIPPCDLVSGKTVKDYLKLCQSFFSAFLTKEKDILSFSPTENIKYEYSSKRYGVYTLNEMTKLVNQFLLEKGWKKWVFLLLAYTGARRNEITSLTVNNVRFDNDTKRYYLMIEESKTDAGIRQIPLHTKLIDWGFIDFVNSKGNGSLFPEITYNNQVTNVFHTIRNSLEINYLDDYKDRRIVHSFRHTFFTNAVTKQNITLVQQVVGHEHSDTGVSQVYTHRVALHRLLCVVDSINWV
ncbi:tyrosine-type recombinase/integrase [Yersinia aleksiciae]|nr:tyrosine-type recombinase/integrase [Yersinia aleksiciae]